MLSRLCVIFLFLITYSNSHAVELCLAIDGSGSMSDSDFNLQIQGIAAAIESPAIVPQNGAVNISVVQFANDAVVEVGSTAVTSQASATALANTIRAINKLGGGTDIGAAITACTGAFSFLANHNQVIDVSTDGHSSNPVPARIAAVAAGVDVVNAIGVGGGIDVNQLEQMVWPQPSSAPPQPGFVQVVNDFNSFTAAIESKIKAEIGAASQKSIPTLSEWSLILLSFVLLILSISLSEKRKSRIRRS